METGLADKVVLVTGASGGIGSAIARRFAAEGARVVIHYRRSRRAAETLASELGSRATLSVRADLTREVEVRRLFREVRRQWGRIDTLVANAGSWETRDVPLVQMSLRQWRATHNAVLTSLFLSLREFLRAVRVQRQGNAVLIGSTAAIFGEAGHADYASAKSAVAYGLVRTMKNEIARLAPPTRDYAGGRINCVCPGWTVVPRTAPKLGDPKVVSRVTATLALPRVAKPDDIAAPVVFLASDRLARHVTGQTLVVAGGMEGRLLWEPEELNAAVPLSVSKDHVAG